jgi:outer membrane protein assembly factor BamB
MTHSRRFALSLALVSAATLGIARAAETPTADEILETTGVSGGLVVQIGCGDGSLLADLGSHDRLLVHGLCANADNVAKARRTIQDAGCYGKASVAQFDGKTLPYVDRFVNLIIAEDLGDLPKDEVLRVLAPLGVAYIKDGGAWTKIANPWPADIDEWTHYLHGPNNNAVAADEVAAQPRSLQWITEPRFGRSHEEMASVSTAVSARGRVFYIVDDAPFASIRFRGQWNLAARDAFNGVLLWKREIPQWNDHLRHFRSGPVHLQRRLAAVDDRVYVTLGLAAPVTAIDAATGETVKTYRGTEHTEEIIVDGDVLYVTAGTSETRRVGGGLHGRDEPKPTDFRFIAAIDIESGEMLWKHAFAGNEGLLPLTLAVDESGVYYQSTKGVGRLDAKSGKQNWLTPRDTPARRMGFSAPTLVVSDGVVLCADREASASKPELAPAKDGKISWGVHGWNEGGYSRKSASMLRAYSTENGEELWNASCAEQYNAPTDVFVVDGVVWVGTGFKGYDLKSGNEIRTLNWRGAPVSMPHHRCYRNKATSNYILTGRSGVEVVSLEDGWIGNNSWIRGACQYGIMPANGLIYAPPNACACNNKVKVLGLTAAAPDRKLPEPAPTSERIKTGPAYGDVGKRKAAACDWTMYRANNARGGAVATTIPTDLKSQWTTKIGGKLTQPIAVENVVYVASTDAHTVHALSAADGKTRWTFTAEGRIDSSPTFYRGALLFGSAAGHVYCLRAEDGALVWRFRAAPHQRLIGSFGQLESLWPVNGSVLVQNDEVFVAAGRNTYLDGGVTLYRLDPDTGAAISKTVLCDVDPETGKQTGVEGSGGFDMQGVRTDLLSGDGETVFMKHYRFDGDGQPMAENKPHLLSVDGFLGEEWFVRSYWIYGTTVRAGWGGWAAAASSAPAARIMSIGDSYLFGYGRESIAGGATGHKADAYHLWCRARQPATPAAAPKDVRRGDKKRPKAPALAAPKWSVKDALIVRAMALTPNALVVAGPPDLGKKTSGVLAYENEDEALAGFHGERGVFLRVLSTEDGSTLGETKLDALPVFDGMSIANGKVFTALRDGSVVCLGK